MVVVRRDTGEARQQGSQGLTVPLGWVVGLTVVTVWQGESIQAGCCLEGSFREDTGSVQWDPLGGWRKGPLGAELREGGQKREAPPHISRSSETSSAAGAWDLNRHQGRMGLQRMGSASAWRHLKTC